MEVEFLSKTKQSRHFFFYYESKKGEYIHL